MNSHKNSGGSSSLVAAMALFLTLLFAALAPAWAQTDKCADGNTGITLSPGFCATVFADKLGHARHLAVAPNGVVYVNTWSGRYFRNDTPPPGGFLIGDDYNQDWPDVMEAADAFAAEKNVPLMNSPPKWIVRKPE